MSGRDKSGRWTKHLSTAKAPLGIAAEKHASYGIMADAAPVVPPGEAPRRVLLRQPELMPCAWPSCVLAASADDVTCPAMEIDGLIVHPLTCDLQYPCTQLHLQQAQNVQRLRRL